MASFDLLVEKWVPVRMSDGSLAELSLTDALVEASAIRSVEDDSPLVVSSVLRLLLAMVHRAVMGPETVRDTSHMLVDGRFPVRELRDYLDRWGGRFNLFDAGDPFYQVAAMRDVEAVFPVSKLVPERASGNNPVLFDHCTDPGCEAVGAPEVARMLLSHQMTALTSGRSRLSHTKDSPSGRAALVFASGRTLLETILLNLQIYRGEHRDHDRPVWEQDAPDLDRLRTSPERRPRGITDRYTWMSRSVLLLPEESDDGRAKVSKLVYASGWAPDLGESAFWRDPMAAYRSTEDGRIVPVGLRTSRAFWRDFSALLPPSEGRGTVRPEVLEVASTVLDEAGETDRRLTVSVFGQVAVPGQPKLESWRHEEYPLPRRLAGIEFEQVHAVLEQCLGRAEETGKALRQAGWTLASALLSTGDRRPHRQDVSNLLTSFPLLGQFWSRMETEFPGLLSRLGEAEDDGSEAYDWWTDQLRSRAWSSFYATCRGIGASAAAMRAAAAAERVLGRRLREALELQGGRAG
ncbi:type I-E CRISPR-associated protein Cse1/CasA [Candidatus Fermentibacterales bacterium]|nr:type I-E CRISPR-associated protein Cse1/CasA [Candidatus Fermentibacterales bacterium]